MKHQKRTLNQITRLYLAGRLTDTELLALLEKARQFEIAILTAHEVRSQLREMLQSRDGRIRRVS